MLYGMEVVLHRFNALVMRTYGLALTMEFLTTSKKKNEAQYLTKVLAAWHANRRGLTEVRHEHELLVGRDI